MYYIFIMQVFEAINNLMHITLGFKLGNSDSCPNKLFESIVLTKLHKNIHLLLKLKCIIIFYYVLMIQ